jgi:hypothetical protein
MKKTFTLTALLFTVIFSSSSYAKITQCEGSYKYWSKPTKLKINIIHPNKDKDYALLSLRDPDDGKFIEFLNKGDPVRLDYIGFLMVAYHQKDIELYLWPTILETS